MSADMTKVIMDAWEDIQDAEAEEAPTIAPPAPAEPEPVEPEDEPEETPEEEPEPEDPEEPELPAAGDEPDEPEEPEPEEPEVDPEVKAFLDKYQGDTEKALKGAAELQRLLGRQGGEKAAALQKVDELERQLAQAQAFSGLGVFLNDEQVAWVDEAVQAPNPGVYVHGAIEAGEFELARAVCREWARENPFEGMRAGQLVDQVEAQQQTQAQQQPVDHNVLLSVLQQNFPDMTTYEPKMVETLQKLGPHHPLVADAQSDDLDRAVRGIVGIYEIARASSATVQETRAELRKTSRENGDKARRDAVVSSATASPSATETPRSVKLGPGLTLEQLEEEFSRP